VRGCRALAGKSGRLAFFYRGSIAYAQAVIPCFSALRVILQAILREIPLFCMLDYSRAVIAER
jgi:hypothetical protein